MAKVAVLVWCVLMAAALGLPFLEESPTWAEDLTRYTVRPALLYYAAAATLMLLLRPAEWDATAPRGRLARACWTLGWAAYLIHLAAAFGCFHHGSHAAAVAHTQERSGFGEGIYVSHLFTLVWTADVAWWWLWPQSYAGRSPWIDRLLHGFMLFVIVNATVVFETGLIRWAGLAVFGELAAVWAWRVAGIPTSQTTADTDGGSPTPR
jgi:hypothetical protein